MKTALIRKLKISLSYFLVLAVNYSCRQPIKVNETDQNYKLSEEHVKMDSLWIEGSSKTYKNYRIKFILEADTSGYLSLVVNCAKDKQTIIRLPGSKDAYSYGAEFSKDFDSDSLIANKLKRTGFDFIVSSFNKRESLFYYFTVNDCNNVTLEKIFKIFRYSNNYGVEPEQIELSQFNISININDIDLLLQSESELKKGKPDSFWRYMILPNSDKIIPIQTVGRILLEIVWQKNIVNYQIPAAFPARS
jgi:hypothetical protein